MNLSRPFEDISGESTRCIDSPEVLASYFNGPTKVRGFAMLRKGQQYLEGLRDQRQIYLGGEIVSDVTTHPAFHNSAHTIASLYDAVCEDPHHLAYRATDDGQLYNAIWLRAKTSADLAARRRVHQAWADISHGLIGRSPDHVAGFLTGMACEPQVANVHGQGFDKNLLAYWEYVRQRDLYVTYAVAPPARARRTEVTHTPSSSGTPKDPQRSSALRVVGENDSGITVWGTKILATAAPLADELLIGNLLPLGPGEEEFAVTFATPVNAEGVKILPRKPYELYAANALDDPLAMRYDETDAVVFCDNVFIPWDRVFTYRHLDTGLAIFTETPAHVLGNAQAHTRLLSKLRLTLGTIHKVSTLTGTWDIPVVKDALAGLATEVAVLESLIAAQDASPHEWPHGFLSPNLLALYGTLAWSAEAVPGFLHEVRYLLGSQPFQQASDASVFTDPDAAQLFAEAFAAPSVEEARERYKLMKLAWDLIGSEFASRHLQYEMFYAGPRHVTRARMGHVFDWEAVDRLAERTLSDVDDWIGLQGDDDGQLRGLVETGSSSP